MVPEPMTSIVLPQPARLQRLYSASRLQGWIRTPWTLVLGVMIRVQMRRILRLCTNVNIVHDSDDDDVYRVMESDGENDDGASGDGDSDSEGELDDKTDGGQGEEGEEEADDPLIDSSLIDAVGGLKYTVVNDKQVVERHYKTPSQDPRRLFAISKMCSA
ncbi:hypothetical protein PI126_g17877 [Phytophthora idaei]|nr:hypothetical protein PI126_g17877 [Phytophthora idaei]